MNLPPRPDKIFLYDGTCGLCLKARDFVAHRDLQGRFHLVPLQSDEAQALLKDHGLSHIGASSLVYLDGPVAYTQSSGAIRILMALGKPWAYPLLLIPPPIRNFFYQLVAKLRYRLFGQCDLRPPPAPPPGGPSELPYDQTVVVIPAYNESKNIERMIRALFECSPSLSVLIVEDGSPDGTAQIVKGLKEFERLFMIERGQKLGLGSAYVTGLQWAVGQGFEYVVQMDCDFGHDPREIPVLLRAALSFDLVVGSRYMGGVRVINWPIRRLFMSLAMGWYVRLITGLPLWDPTGGFKCFRRRALEALDWGRIVSKGYAFQYEVNYRAWKHKSLRVREVPITFYERALGDSKMGMGIILESFWVAFRIRWGS